MVTQTKLSLLMLVVLLLVKRATSEDKRKEVVSRTPTGRASSPETVVEEVESQQVSLITKVEYLPVETKKKRRPKGFKYHKSKGEAYNKEEHTDSHKTHDNAITYEKSNKGSNSKSHKDGHHRRGGKKYKGGDHKSSHYGKKDNNVKGRKGHAFGRKGHNNKGSKTKGFKNVWQKEESGRKKKFYDDAENLKYDSHHDHLHIYHETEEKGGHKGGAKEGSHYHDLHGKKHHHKAGGFHDGIQEQDSSYGHREDYRDRSDYEQKGGHKEAHGNSKGSKDAGGHGDGGHGGHGSHSVLYPIKVVVKRRKLRPTQNDMEDPVQGAHSSNVISEKEAPQGAVFGRRRRKKVKPNKKIASETVIIPVKRISSQTKIIPGKKIKFQRVNTPNKRIEHQRIDVPNKRIQHQRINVPNKRIQHQRVNIPNKEVYFQKIYIPNKKSMNGKTQVQKQTAPMSVFVRKEDLEKEKEKLRNLKIEQGKYAGYLKEEHKPLKKVKDIAFEENNEIVHDDLNQERYIAPTVQKPVVVTKPFKTSYSSKEETSKEVKISRKPNLILLPGLQKERSQQVSVVSDANLKPSSTGKWTKPKSYSKAEAHESSHHKAKGQKVVKGGSKASGFKEKHHKNHSNSHDSKFSDVGGEKHSGHDHNKHHSGDYKGGKKASKGHAHGNKGHHHKGHSDKGFKNVHHKLEYAVKKNFYHEDEDKKNHNVFDEFDALFAKKREETLKAHDFFGDHHDYDYGHKGHDFDDHFHDFKKGQKGHYHHEGHHDNHHHHGHKKHSKGSHGHHHDDGGHGHGHHGHGGHGHHGHGGGHGHHGHGGRHGNHGHGGGHGHHGHGGGQGHHGHGGGHGNYGHGGRHGHHGH